MICFLSGLYQTTRGRGHPLKVHFSSFPSSSFPSGYKSTGELVLDTLSTGTKKEFFVLISKLVSHAPMSFKLGSLSGELESLSSLSHCVHFTFDQHLSNLLVFSSCCFCNIVVIFIALELVQKKYQNLKCENLNHHDDIVEKQLVLR